MPNELLYPPLMVGGSQLSVSIRQFERPQRHPLCALPLQCDARRPGSCFDIFDRVRQLSDGWEAHIAEGVGWGRLFRSASPNRAWPPNRPGSLAICVGWGASRPQDATCIRRRRSYAVASPAQSTHPLVPRSPAIASHASL